MSGWEYRTLSDADARELAALGRDGWELVGVPASASGTYVFKRPAPSFREQVTLDQKRRYYALWGIAMTEPDGGTRR